MRRLRNPDKSHLRVRHELMSVMLTISLFVRRLPVALLFVSAEWPVRMTQEPRPDRLVPRQKFHHCQSASGNPHESSEIVPRQPGWHAQQDWVLNCALVSSPISPDLPPWFSPCVSAPPLPALCHTSTIRACERNRSMTSISPVAEWSVGLLSQKGEWLSRKTSQRPQQPDSWHISVLSLHWQTLF